jgi:hypothetical protein
MADIEPTLPSEIEESTGQSVELGAESQDTVMNSSSNDELEKVESLDTLNPSTQKKPDYSEVIADSWADQIRNGKKTVENLDEPDHQWLKEKVLNRLGYEEPKQQMNVEADIEKYMQKQKFEENKKFVEGLPKDMRNKIIRETKALQGTGADIMKAFEFVINNNKDSIEEHNTTQTVRKEAQRLPTGKGAQAKNTYTREYLADPNLSIDEYKQIMDRVDKGEATLIN